MMTIDEKIKLKEIEIQITNNKINILKRQRAIMFNELGEFREQRDYPIKQD